MNIKQKKKLVRERIRKLIRENNTDAGKEKNYVKS